MRKTYLISYDLADGGDYNALFEAIKAYGTWAHITKSFWAVETESSAVDVRENIAQYLPSGSRLIVIQSGTESAWMNAICSNAWLRKNL